MSKILITGASGFLGTKLLDLFSRDNEVLGTYSSNNRQGLVPLDITNTQQVHDLMRSFRPDTIIHTVALSDPDICEQQRDRAESINFGGTQNVVEASREVNAKLHYISTVYVFDGQKGHYTEDDKPSPINFYGETKMRAEQAVMGIPNYAIYRFDKLYGYNGEGRPNDILSKVFAGKPFEVNSDQVRQPLLIDDIGRAIQRVDELGQNGVFHLAGPDNISKYELAQRLAGLLGKEDLVIPVPEKQQIARRPLDASIATVKAEHLGITFTSLESALKRIDTELHGKTIEGQQRGKEK
jgi:dTDP-4-dehydrorhamnose reductase